MKEIHLFILWENALYKKDVILKDIESNFRILNVYNISWSEENFSNNLSRFYGTSLPDGSAKEVHCGRGNFYLIIIEDTNSKYEIRNTSKGDKLVNSNMFDKKVYYRELTGGGHRIHATNTVSETNHDLTLLIGKNVDDYMKENYLDWNGDIINLKKDLFGVNGWQDVKEIFYALNNCCNYAILRNYEGLPDEIYCNNHNDIDLICEKHEDVAYVLNAEKVFPEEYRVHYKTRLLDDFAYFDLRYLNDDYYCYYLEEEILKTRILNKKGFYTISNELYFYTLLYHALIHKPVFSDDYKQKLLKLFDENIDESKWHGVLKEWLKDNKYYITKPIDESVYFNEENALKSCDIIYGRYNKIKDLNNKIDELNNNTIELQNQINIIHESKSWKYTNFLRKIRRKLLNGEKNKQ